MNALYSVLRFLAYLPFRLLFPTKVINKRDFPKHTKIILVSNHLSWADIPITAICLPGFRHFIAKKEVGEKPLGRKMAKSLGAILIDRGKADMASMRDIIGVLRKGESVTIFPEGTRNKVDTSLQEVKTGVVMFSMKGDAPIVPINIHEKARLFRKNYVYVLPPFELTELKGRRLDNAAVAEGGEIVAEKLALAKKLTDAYVANRRNKLFRRTVKQHKKARKNALKTMRALHENHRG